MLRIVVLCSLLLALIGGAAAQAPAPTNLQVLPKDMPQQQLFGMMQGVSAALGVQCNHCHIPREFAKDDVPAKAVARSMIKMVMNMREHKDEFLPDGRDGKINCWTCHRGSAMIPDAPPPPARGGRGKKGGKKGGA